MKTEKYIKIRPKKKIGKGLKKIKEKYFKKYLKQNFAKKCSIVGTTYNHYETGYSLINCMYAYAICKTYKVSMDWLIGRK